MEYLSDPDLPIILGSMDIRIIERPGWIRHFIQETSRQSKSKFALTFGIDC